MKIKVYDIKELPLKFYSQSLFPRDAHLQLYLEPFDYGYDDTFTDNTPFIEQDQIDSGEEWTDKVYERNIKLACDFDGVLKDYPIHFKRLFDKVIRSGGKTYLVTGRPPSLMKHTMEFLEIAGFKFDAYCFYPVEYKEYTDELDKQIGSWKGDVCKTIGIDIMFEDRMNYANSISNVSFDTLVLMPLVK